MSCFIDWLYNVIYTSHQRRETECLVVEYVGYGLRLPGKPASTTYQLRDRVNHVSSQRLCSSPTNRANDRTVVNSKKARVSARTVPGTRYSLAVIVPAFGCQCLSTALGNRQCHLDFTRRKPRLRHFWDYTSCKNVCTNQTQVFLLSPKPCCSCKAASLSEPSFGERRGWIS